MLKANTHPNNINFQGTRDSTIYFSTSGSSGVPKIFPLNFSDVERNSKLHGSGYKNAGILETDVVATWGMPGFFNSEFTVYLALKETGCTILPFGDFSNFKNLYEHIEQLKASVLLVMPSDFIEFANYLRTQKLQLSHVRLFIYGGESLYAQDRELFKTVFPENIDFRAVYQTSDCGSIGYQCPKCPEGHFHIHHEFQNIEIVDQDSEGIGDILTTNQIRLEKPIVRQYVGDRGYFVDLSCDPMGRKGLVLTGRRDDFIKVWGEKIPKEWFLFLREKLRLPLVDFHVQMNKTSFGDDQVIFFSNKIWNSLDLQNEVKNQLSLMHTRYAKILSLRSSQVLNFEKYQFKNPPKTLSGKVRMISDQRQGAIF